MGLGAFGEINNKSSDVEHMCVVYCNVYTSWNILIISMLQKVDLSGARKLRFVSSL